METTTSGGDGLLRNDTPPWSAVPALLLLQILDLHRQRQDIVRAQLSLNNQIEAVYRRLTGLTAIERARLRKQASCGLVPADDSAVGDDHCSRATLTLCVSPDRAQTTPHADRAARCKADPAYFAAMELSAAFATVGLAAVRDLLDGAGRYVTDNGKRRYVSPLPGYRADLEKRLETFARELPVWPWAHAVQGFGALGLAQIVAECGDLANYDGPAKVWKRMGLAVLDGERQRKHTDPAKALLHGYNPQRRSIMYNIADSLMKGNRDGEYRSYYLAEKARQAAKHPADAPIAAHNRALRHLAKRLLRDLWRAWNGLGGFDTQPGSADPPATFFAAD